MGVGLGVTDMVTLSFNGHTDSKQGLGPEPCRGLELRHYH